MHTCAHMQKREREREREDKNEDTSKSHTIRSTSAQSQVPKVQILCRRKHMG